MLMRKEDIQKIHRDCLNDSTIAAYNQQKVSILSLASPYMIINKTKDKILEQGIDERSQKEIDRLDLLIQERIEKYNNMIF